MGDITKNFSFAEFKVSDSYPQEAEAIEMTNLDKYKCFWLVHLFLQPLRDIINEGSVAEIPISITSGIRRGVLNELVGGVAHSDHLFNYYSCAVDFKIGDTSIKKYWEAVYAFCQKRKEWIKQIIYYLPSAGGFIHLSLRDKTDRKWERLYCVSRSSRMYFQSLQEASEYERQK